MVVGPLGRVRAAMPRRRGEITNGAESERHLWNRELAAGCGRPRPPTPTPARNDGDDLALVPLSITPTGGKSASAGLNERPEPKSYGVLHVHDLCASVAAAPAARAAGGRARPCACGRFLVACTAARFGKTAPCKTRRCSSLAAHRRAVPPARAGENLAAISRSVKFSGNEKDLLTSFLERCDLIKFARSFSAAPSTL